METVRVPDLTRFLVELRQARVDRARLAQLRGETFGPIPGKAVPGPRAVYQIRVSAHLPSADALLLWEGTFQTQAEADRAAGICQRRLEDEGILVEFEGGPAQRKT